MRTKLSLTLEDAQPMMAAALRAAETMGRAVSVAIVDDAGDLLAFARLTGARGYTIDLATRKARAAASVGAPTVIIAARSAEYTAGQGGLPVMMEGACAGAIGVSGALPEEDDEIGAAGIAALSATRTKT